MKRVALFGVGRIGTVHFRNCFLNERIEIAWVVEDNKELADKLIRQYGAQNHVKVTTSDNAKDVWEDQSVHFVIVCTPSHAHEQIVMEALGAGKAVFCEKPLASTYEAVQKCYSQATKYSKPLFCAFQRRYDPNLRGLYNTIRTGDLGAIRTLKSISRDPPHMAPIEYLRGSGGILVDSCIHDLDLLCWMVGETPESVCAIGHAYEQVYAEIGDVSSANIQLKFPGGALAQVEVSRNVQLQYDQRVEILCENGLLQSCNQAPTTTVLTNRDGALMDPIHDDFRARYSMAYVAELDHFVDVLEGKAREEITAESTLMVNRVVQACQQSMKTGQVIRLQDIQ